MGCQVCWRDDPCDVEHEYVHRMRNVGQGLYAVTHVLRKTYITVQVFLSDASSVGVQRKFDLPFGCAFCIDCGHGATASAQRIILHNDTREPFMLCTARTGTVHDLAKLLSDGWELAETVPEFTM